MKVRKKVGIMGGTFNPVHIVHLILAENAYRDFDLDQIILLPSGDPPHKAGSRIAPAKDREAMLRIAASNVPYFKISRMEIERTGYSYTSDTLAQLKEENPDTDFYFIMGGDSIFQIETWHEPAAVMANCIIIAAIRNNVDRISFEKQVAYLKDKYHADIRILELTDIELSSSGIRKRCQEGRSVRFMVPEGVDEYIAQHGLYQCSSES